MFDIKLYDREFFEWHRTHVRESSIRCMDWYIERFDPESVIDFGCGIGSYLESCYNHNVDFTGIDIAVASQEYTPKHIRPAIHFSDVTSPELEKLFRRDTVISFETAEHIEPSGTYQFIQNLVNATGKTLLFTAAPPGQEGTGHINCKPAVFWLKEFSKYLQYDCEKTKEISEAWEKLGAPWYIVKNLLVFER